MTWVRVVVGTEGWGLSPEVFWRRTEHWGEGVACITPHSWVGYSTPLGLNFPISKVWMTVPGGGAV